MANNDQDESGLPVTGNEPRKTSDLLPRTYRTDSNKKFLQATLDQLTQPGRVKKLNGFIGRKNAKASKSDDIFIQAPDTQRQDYQLEPGAIIQDQFENVTFFKDYIDYVNQLNVFGGNVVNHERTNKQEFYSWDPHINWDKFVNFQNYYWLPYGPDTIKVFGQQLEIESTYTIDLVDEDDNYAYLFTPNGLTRNPTLRLFRGQTYNFTVNSPGNPFSFKLSRVGGDLDRYIKGVSASAIEEGVITFKVRKDCPDLIYYVSEKDPTAGGVIQILDIEENTFLDLEKDILGKKDYTLNSGVKISNGMKLNFEGNVVPSQYKEGNWYVDGVGTGITLIPETALEIISTYTEESELLFDDTAFDLDPFSVASAYPRDNDYLVMARGSKDRNPWSRYNRWFHEDVIKVSAAANGKLAEIDQSRRAIRPIIEFEADLKLHNFGHVAKKDVDLIDNFTTDIFSIIEGSTGYNVDGVDLANGMRVLFTADPDRLVKDKIFKVNFITITIPQRQISFVADSSVNPNTDIITFNNGEDFEHGLTTGAQLTYLNNGNNSINGLSNRQQYYVLAINQTQIKLYSDKQLTKQVDILSRGTGTHKFEVFSGIRRQINLVEEPDATPQLYETVLIKIGEKSKGSMYWYDGSNWKLAQAKTTVNQPILFDMFDDNGNSYSDITVYDGSTFSGNKIFSYKEGSGSVDNTLGFALSYKNINNVGDIVFQYDLLNSSFTFKQQNIVQTKRTDIGFLRKISSLETFSYVNGWKKSDIKNVQPIVRIFKESGLVNNFPVDVYDNTDDLSDLEVRVYVNGSRLYREQYTLERGPVRFIVVLDNDVELTDIVTLRCFSKQQKNNNGYYEIPISLQNNPLNKNLETFTLGEVVDHVSSIVDNIIDFQGVYPGNGNLRDLGNLTAFGTRIVQHSSPLNLSLYHLTKFDVNVFKALTQAQDDYATFKRTFLITAGNTGQEMDARRHVDLVLEMMLKDRPKNSPYYLSDMFGYAGSTRLEYLVEDGRFQRLFSISRPFNLANLSNNAVYVYRNGEQLIEGIDYVFGENDVFFNIVGELNDDDIIEVFEYESTDGSFCPPTPTKLGLYPKFKPRKYIDDTYLEPREVIQGHDGSITLAYGDYRDDLLLELELRIYNNIKQSYDPALFDIWDHIPGYSRPTLYNKEEFERVLSPSFFQWTNNINQDYTKQTYWDQTEPFTFNYRSNYFPDGTNSPAFWRGIYHWLLDTDRPHTHPWECLGFSLEPSWWQDTYGPAPYTKDNQLLWEDLSQGIIREPGLPPRYHAKFVRPLLASSAPVDELGNLISPLDTNYVTGPLPSTSAGFYAFGDRGPVETAWRRSSYYPFAIIKTILLLNPSVVFGSCLDRSRQIRNSNNQIVYKSTGLRIKLSDLILPSTVNDTTRILASGLVNYIIDYATADITFKIDEYKEDLQQLNNKVSYKLGGFTSKNKFNILLDSKNPTSSGGVFVPDENFNIFLNTSSPVKKLAYSGVIVSKFPDGFELRGYNVDEPFFTYYPYRQNDRLVRIGGMSESYVSWDANKTYVAGKIVLYGNVYYRIKVNHQSTDTFDESFYARLPGLPMIGGTEAILRKGWDKNQELYLAYGTKLATIQEVVDFLQGYGIYLEEQGFVFDQYNAQLKSVTNWENSINEFLFWTTQNWGEGSAVSLSPAASKLVINSDKAVVDDIRNSFYGYKIFRVDGQLLPADFTSTFREGTTFTLIPENTAHGIYGGIFYLIQKEHVLVLDNTTLFNDVIYDQEAGYKQERVKVLGYVTTDWNGGFDIPGFIFDQAIIKDFESWTDYNLGDIVKHKEYYYAASKFITGSENFNSEDWTLLPEKPKPELLPNWDYRSEQFTDFYDLDTDNFDSEQQRMAQHLIGYQNRQYLENIIKDDVSQYKFYQGMIIEKGTQNVLNKLFDVLSADDQESLTFNEEWAVRVGEYGATSTFEEVEFKIDEASVRLNPQPIELVDTVSITTDLIYRIRAGEVYLKPVGYNNNPWPTGNVKKALRSPGYVRYEDVKINVDRLENVVSLDINTFEEGDYVWAAFEDREWNVYRFTKNTFSIEDVEYANGELTLQCNIFPNINVGEIIGIVHSDLIQGFYTVDAVAGRVIKIKTIIKDWQPPFVDSSQILTYKFTSSRINSIDNANDNLPPYIKNKELLWADEGNRNLSYNGQVPYTVYRNEKIYTRTVLENTTPGINVKFGNKVSMSKNGKYVAVATSQYGVYIFEKAPGTDTWFQQQYIEPNLKIASTSGLNFGSEVAFSPDGKWLAIAAPTASNVLNAWRGDFVTTATYAFGDIVQIRNTHFSARRSFTGDGSTVDRFTQDWAPAYLVNTEESQIPSGLVSQGYVNLYLRSPYGQYLLRHSFVSPNPTANEKFGSKMTFAKNGNEYVLAITSAGYNNNQGRVYMFRYAGVEEDSSLVSWHMDYRRSYQGIFSPGKQYYPGDVVFYNYELYECITLQDPNTFESNASGWQLLDEPNVLGYFPQDVMTEIVPISPITISSIQPDTPSGPAPQPGQPYKPIYATINYAAQPVAPFVPGQYLEIRDVIPKDYNGDWLVVSSTTTQTRIFCKFPSPTTPPVPNTKKFVYQSTLSITGFISKVGTSSGSWDVTFSMDAVILEPTVGQSFTISGNANSRYNISVSVVNSTTTQITFRYSSDPGTFGSGTTIARNLAGKIHSAVVSPTRNQNVESVLPNDLFGYDVELSGDGSKMVISAPNADQNVFTNFKGRFKSNEKYDLNDVVYFEGGSYPAGSFIIGQTYVIEDVDTSLDSESVGTTNYIDIGATPDSAFSAKIAGNILAVEGEWITPRIQITGITTNFPATGQATISYIRQTTAPFKSGITVQLSFLPQISVFEGFYTVVSSSNDTTIIECDITGDTTVTSSSSIRASNLVGRVKIGSNLIGSSVPGTKITGTPTFTITGITKLSNGFRVTVTPALPSPLQFATGMKFRISGVSNALYNGTWVIIGKSSTQFEVLANFTASSLGSEGAIVQSADVGIRGFYTVQTPTLVSHPNQTTSFNAYTLTPGKSFTATGVGSGNGKATLSSGYYRYNATFDSSIAGVFVLSGNQSPWTLISTSENKNTGKIFTYEYDGDAYRLVDTLGAQNLNLKLEERFGESMSMSESGNTLAVTSSLYSKKFANQGAVTIFEEFSGSWSPYQTLTSITPGTNHRFGQHVEFMNDDQTLVVYSPNADIKNETTFDSATTKFDNATLRIIDLQILSGRVDIFDRYNTNYIFGESLTTESYNDSSDGYGSSISVGTNNIIVSAPREDDQGYYDSGVVYTYKKPASKFSWDVLHYERPRPNAYKIKKAFLYNRRENLLVKYLDVIDPIQGKIPGTADQEIKFKTYYDPATYTVGDNRVNVDDGMSWTKTNVGQLWWDLTTARFLDNQGGEIIYRSSTWNTLYETASIDIYEWIESKLLPSERDKIADTEKGLISGISGKSKYGDSVYSIKKKYDTISKTFINTYYYWVKNPTVTPNVEGRQLPADSISRLISDPKSFGYPCLALLSPGTFSLVNCGSYVKDKDVVLSVQYWTSDDRENNAHTQWKIISEHPNTTIPYEIEQKWLDSLLGRDKNGRVVPDLRLPVKQRYGVENRPRQSIFINRIEALKQFIERVNSVLKENLIVDEFDLTPLQTLEPQPSAVSGLWDVTIDTDPELRFVGTSLVEQAVLEPVVENGKIVEVKIIQKGRGYVNAPYLRITGKGKNAEIKTVIDELGQITSFDIINQGSGYNSDTILSIRPFTVLVLSDSENFDKWSIYTWNRLERTWLRTKTQTYDVTKFWNYADWYLTGYDQFTKFNFIVENTNELVTLESNVGNIVKVKNVGSGGWLLLEKYNNLVTVDYTQNFKVIGRQNGTIKFLDTLYNFKKLSLGFDGPLYDSEQYDTAPITELAIILDTIKTKLLIDNLKVEYLKLFFAGLRYALYEQPFLDWAMKTSFVKATHNAGPLKQKINYNSDNLEDFENYVKEVKPFRTKVREYVSSYTRLDRAGMSVTDFDLPPLIDEEFKINPLTVVLSDYYSLGSSYSQLLDYPWKHWYDNASYYVENIEISDGGIAYIEPPVVKIIDDYGIVTSTNDLKSNFDSPQSFWVLNEGTMKITATGLPNHSYGNELAENQAVDQAYSQIIPLRGGTYAAGGHAEIPQGIIGYCLNGVPVFNPSAGDLAPEGYEAVTDFNFNMSYASGQDLEYSFNQDRAGGIATEDGEYSYRDFSFREAWISGIGNDLGDIAKLDASEIPYLRAGLEHADGHSKIIGFALDGYPIYGPNGYTLATDPTSGISRMTSSYALKVASYRTGFLKDLQKYPMGIFIQDYEYAGNGTLDKHNGRYCITPDYPNGTYAYFVTTNSAGSSTYPYTIGPTFFGDAAPQDRNDATNGKGTPPRTYSLYNSTAVQATAKAYISNGKVSRISLLTQGRGYLIAPRVVFEGGMDTTVPHRAATAVAMIKNDTVRHNKTVIKFDRITRNYFITLLTQTETFTGSGSKKQFQLRYSPVLTVGSTTVKIDGNEVLRDDYSLTIKKSTVKGYTTYYGILTFETAPSIGTDIEITYDKNFDHLSAADRINFYYNPEIGQLGKDLAQLMTGIDYGGVIVSGLGLNLAGGWDSQPWFTEGWDSYDVDFTDYIVTVSDSTYVFDLPYVPANGEQINVYVNGIRIDDEYFDSYDGITTQPNGRKTAPEGRVMQTWVGNGVTKTIELPNITAALPLDINTGDKVIFRKSTSDGSINPDPKSYDTQLQGGNLSYTTATGFAPDDILVDGGERLITPETSHAPEEIVPGHITDTLSIKVFRLPRSGSSTIISKNYICDGVKNQFDIGQFPNNTVGLFVTKVANSSSKQTLKIDTHYTVDWESKTITFISTPSNGEIVNVSSFGLASNNILDVNYFVGDGSTAEFITNAPWPQLASDSSFQQSIDRLGSIVLVNNEPVEYELFRTNESYETTGFVGIRFPATPDNESIINYMMTADGNASVSLVKSQEIILDGSSISYSLSNAQENLTGAQTFTSIEQTSTTGIGLGSIWNITKYDSQGSSVGLYSAAVVNGGVGFEPLDVITISGSELDGTAPENNCYITVDSVSLTGSILTFTVNGVGSGPEGNAKPYENYILVLANTPTSRNLLRPGQSIYWTLKDNEYVYTIPNYKALPFTLDPSKIKVYINGQQISSLDYTLNNVNLTLEIRDFIYVEGAVLTLTNFEDSDYVITANNIIFDAASIVGYDSVDVVTFYNHSVQNVVRTKEAFNITSTLVPGSLTYYEYSRMKGGTLKLFRMAQADDYIWVAKNKQLLVHSVDYYLDDDHRTVKFKDVFTENDVIDVILFGDKNVTNSFGFMQFKDMLNRTHYKRINKNKSTRLAADLKQRDITIEVENASMLTEPNRSLNLPGVVEINGERIEYFTKIGNTLGHLRRATLGTASPAIHKITSIVLDIGPTETIPYNDEFVVESSISDGSSKNIRLSYTPTKVDVDWFTDTIPANYGRSDEIEVFVGGYRLKKNPYSLFSETAGYPESPEADVRYEAEFSVKGTEEVRLTSEVPENVKITVIKKIGKVWEDPVKARRTFLNIPAGSGGAIFDVTKESTNYSVSLKRGGSAYSVGDILIITGTRLGGTTPDNDIVITVTDVSDDSASSILGFTFAGTGIKSTYTTKTIADSENPIADFLKNTEAVWPQYLADKYQYVLLTDTGESITVDGTEPLELD